MNVSLYNYDLPKQLIAQTPKAKRTDSRMLVMDRTTGQYTHTKISSLPTFLQPGDCLVLNDSRVRPARLLGEKMETGAKIELLILKPLGEDVWETLVKPAKRIKPGTVVQFGNGKLLATALEKSEVDGGWLFRFDYQTDDIETLFNELGDMPLPPYIRERLDDPERYQTVYAKQVGSAAAPTAGLHFTDELLTALQKQGIQIAYLTLHVGLGTFRPVTVEKIEDHQMHAEYFELAESEADKINRTKAAGGRVIAVGTTSIRTLESIAKKNGKLCAANGWTDLFIYPGFSFQVADGLLTNFHLPQSTLLMLVSAFSKREYVLAAYEEAIKEKYRFFSFGDAMLII